MTEALDIRPDWHAPSRNHPPASAGDVVTLWDRFEHREIVATVEEVRWDSWLYGGEWRLFAAGRTYFTSADVRAGDLLALLTNQPNRSE